MIYMRVILYFVWTENVRTQWEWIDTIVSMSKSVCSEAEYFQLHQTHNIYYLSVDHIYFTIKEEDKVLICFDECQTLNFNSAHYVDQMLFVYIFYYY